MSEHMKKPTPPEKRQPRKRRPVLSCDPCIKNKVRCDRVHPCRACCLRGEAQNCVYQLALPEREAIRQQSELDSLRKEVESLRAEQAHYTRVHSNASNDQVKTELNEAQELDSYELRFVQVVGGMSKFPWGGWIERIVQESKKQNTTLVDAVSAISLAYCGAEDRDEDATAHGQRLYVSTLARLQEKLRDPDIASRPEMLYTIMFLSLYELLVLKNPLSWLRHVHGAGLLIRSRGPENFMDSSNHIRGLEHQTFRMFRLFEIILHILIRKSTFLAEAQWKTIPWSQYYPQKDIFDLLLDNLLDVVGMFELGDDIEKGHVAASNLDYRQRELESMVGKFQKRLEKWRYDWVYTYPGMPLDLAEEENRTLTIRELNDVCKPIYSVDGFFAQALGIYCAGHLCVIRIRHVESFQLPCPAYDLVEFICDAAEGQLAREEDPLAALALLFPLRVAYFTPLGNSPFKEKVENLANQIEQKFGFSCVSVILSSALPSFAGSVSLGVPGQSNA